MNITIHYFDYDTPVKVKNTNIAIAGYYTKVQIEDSGTPEEHWYYHGVDLDGSENKKGIYYFDDFELEDNMTVFRY